MSPSPGRQYNTLRIIDASLNRVGEGLRLLEEIARLMLDDGVLTRQLKGMRHGLVTGDASFNQRLLQFRDAEGDVGAYTETAGEDKERDLPAVLVANSRRVQEALRTLEEMAKVPDTVVRLDAEKFKQARFDLYTIEKKLMSGLMRREKLEHISGLYVIIDKQLVGEHSCAEVAEQAISGGAGVIQLRHKMQNRGELLPLARQLKTLCAEKGALFIVNDFLDVALAADADGLHVGQDDLPVAVARELLPLGKILGCSVNTVEQAVEAQVGGADYIAVGSIYPTSSKEAIKLVGLERLRQVREAVSLPLVAIGGINRDNASDVMAAGADSVAVISAVAGAESPEEAAREIVAVLGVEK